MGWLVVPCRVLAIRVDSRRAAPRAATDIPFGRTGWCDSAHSRRSRPPRRTAPHRPGAACARARPCAPGPLPHEPAFGPREIRPTGLRPAAPHNGRFAMLVEQGNCIENRTTHEIDVMQPAGCRHRCAFLVVDGHHDRQKGREMGRSFTAANRFEGRHGGYHRATIALGGPPVRSNEPRQQWRT